MTETKHIYSKQDFTLEVLMSFTFYLMSNYAWQPDKNTGAAISKYLDKLAEHPACDSVLLARVVKQLSGQWQLIHESQNSLCIHVHNKNFQI